MKLPSWPTISENKPNYGLERIKIVLELLGNPQNQLKNVLATYTEAEDLINIGAYKSGSNKEIDYAISKINAVNNFLTQNVDEKFTFEQTIQLLKGIFVNG